MSDYDDGDDRAPRRLIHRKKQELQAVRDRFWEEGVGGDFNPQTKRYIATVALQFWDVLYEFRDESVLSDGDFPDMSPIRSRIGQHTKVPSSSQRRSSGQTLTSVPAIDELDGWYLIELTKELDAVANKLGFSAHVESKHDVFGVDPDWEAEEEEADG